MAEYPGDQYGTRIGEPLFDDYAEAGQSPNPGMGVWFFRTAWDGTALMNGGMDPDAAMRISIAKHRREWRQALGLPPLPIPDAPIAPPTYSGNLCGVHVNSLPPIPGGASDPSLVLSWFIDRYNRADRESIYAAWLSRGYLDVAMSWPDARQFGHTPDSFAAILTEVVQFGFRPCLFLLSDEIDPHHNVSWALQQANLILDHVLSPRLVSRVCLGWELSQAYTTEELQILIDHLTPRILAAHVRTYVHFQPGYADWRQPGGTFASWWNPQIGKLHGVLFQFDPASTDAQILDKISDVLQRFAGGFNTSPDNGFGEPFNLIAYEISASPQFYGQISEAEGDRRGRVALAAPPVGHAHVLGSGNGF